VLVACAHDDPGRGIVVGGLVDDRGPSLEVAEGELPFQLRTRGGHMLELSDAGRRIRLEHACGSRLDFGPEGIDLLARGDLVLRAPGRSITIAAARVDFKKEGDA
jgi:hypothetical protein